MDLTGPYGKPLSLRAVLQGTQALQGRAGQTGGGFWGRGHGDLTLVSEQATVPWTHISLTSGSDTSCPCH